MYLNIIDKKLRYFFFFFFIEMAKLLKGKVYTMFNSF